MNPDKIIIIQYGSENLRIGFASQEIPHTIPNVIAKLQTSAEFPDIEEEQETEEDKLQREQEIFKIEKEVFPDGFNTLNTNSVEIFTKESCSVGEIRSGASWRWTTIPEQTKDCDSCYFGEEALKLDHEDKRFKLFYPFKYSYFNITNTSTQESCCADFQKIIEYSVKTRMDLEVSDLRNYLVALIIPDLFQKTDVKLITTMLLNELNFGAIFLHQSAVCSAFGSGLGSACVVDIGHEKTSITCIDDEGLVVNKSRIHLNYGGFKLSEILLDFLTGNICKDKIGSQNLNLNYLIHPYYFPYKECNLNIGVDRNILMELRERLCHFDNSDFNVKQFDFEVTRKGEFTKLYRININECTILAPMFFFYPKGFKNLKDPIFISKYETEDTWSAEFMKETSTTPVVPNAIPKRNPIPDVQTNTSYLSLDNSILSSITCIGRSDLRKKLFQNILLVGGSSLISNFPLILEDKLNEKIMSNSQIDKIKVFYPRKNIDSRYVSWKGAALMVSLESAQKLWITKNEWNKKRVDCFKEKIPFRYF